MMGITTATLMIITVGTTTTSRRLSFTADVLALLGLDEDREETSESGVAGTSRGGHTFDIQHE